MYKSKRRKFDLPPRWLNCPKIGNVVNDMFVPFKTPLDKKFNAAPANQFSLDSLLSSSKSEKIGLIVNLTKTDKYYNAEQLKDKTKFSRIACAGHEGAPTLQQVQSFIEICSNHFNHNEGSHIGVHCTHGYNRTGFMIVCFLIEKCDVELDVAISIFANARSPGIYKQDYLNELAKRYDYDGEELVAPETPNWDESGSESGNQSDYANPIGTLSDASDDSDAESLTSNKSSELLSSRPSKQRKRPAGKKPYVAPKIAAFMEGVSKVSVVTDVSVIEELQQKVRDLMESTKYQFIGSQPVSMTMANVGALTTRKYMVSWKADGTRYIMLIADKDLVYMFDRDNCVYKVENINFPRPDGEHYTDTLVDGEMVIDTYQGKKFPRYLIYDVMVLDQKYVGDLPFPKRCHLIKTGLIDTRAKFVTPDTRNAESFGVRIKDFWPIPKTRDIWEGKFRKQLCHEMDGLIFQPAGAEDAYQIGRCDTILKWKPPNLNSIDFLLKCEYRKEKDMLPRFVGSLYVTGSQKPFGEIDKIKGDLRQKYNNKIVECTINKKDLSWEIMRERTDKSLPNHITTATSVLESIKNPVHIENVYSAIDYAIRHGLA